MRYFLLQKFLDLGIGSVESVYVFCVYGIYDDDDLIEMLSGSGNVSGNDGMVNVSGLMMVMRCRCRCFVLLWVGWMGSGSDGIRRQIRRDGSGNCLRVLGRGVEGMDRCWDHRDRVGRGSRSMVRNEVVGRGLLDLGVGVEVLRGSKVVEVGDRSDRRVAIRRNIRLFRRRRRRNEEVGVVRDRNVGHSTEDVRVGIDLEVLVVVGEDDTVVLGDKGEGDDDDDEEEDAADDGEEVVGVARRGNENEVDVDDVEVDNHEMVLLMQCL